MIMLMLVLGIEYLWGSSYNLHMFIECHDFEIFFFKLIFLSKIQKSQTKTKYQEKYLQIQMNTLISSL